MSGPSFSFPLRPFADFYCAASFLAADYHAKRGKWHRGSDLNLRTGGDTDLGYPVSSCVPGVVVSAQKIVGSWGGIVVVRADEWVKKLAEEAFERPIGVLEVQYAHLHHVTVRAGEPLNAGDVVGSLGKGTFGDYLAHLHIEVRTSEFAAGLAQGGTQADYEYAQAHCLDPERFFQLLPLSDHPNTLAQRPYYAPSRILHLEHSGETNTVVHAVGDKLYLRGF